VALSALCNVKVEYTVSEKNVTLYTAHQHSLLCRALY